jgi:hypothetical protein
LLRKWGKNNISFAGGISDDAARASARSGAGLGAGLGLAVVAAIGMMMPAAAAEKRFGLTSFERVELLVDADVEIVGKAPVSALATGDQDALDRLVVEARDGRLVISMRRYAGDDKRASRGGPLHLRLFTPSLRGLSVVGAGNVRVDRLRGQRVAIALQGPGSIDVADISADQLALHLVGNGHIRAAGKVKQAQVNLAGASQLQGAALLVDDVTLQNEGAGDHQLTAVKRAKITSRGAGRIDIGGRPSCTVENMGMGRVLCGGK